jgi:hypothetical protein
VPQAVAGQPELLRLRVFTGGAKRWLLSLDAARVWQFALEAEQEAGGEREEKRGPPPPSSPLWAGAGQDGRMLVKHVAGGGATVDAYVCWARLRTTPNKPSGALLPSLELHGSQLPYPRTTVRSPRKLNHCCLTL